MQRFRVALCLVAVTLTCQTSAQIVRTERIFVGKLDHFNGGLRGASLSVFALKRKGGKYLEVAVTGSLSPYRTGTTILGAVDLSDVIKNLEQMLRESASTSDEFTYNHARGNFSVNIAGADESRLYITVQGVTAVSGMRPRNFNLDILREVIDLLKKGEAVLEAKASELSP
jgi:hypothetical protein